MHRMRALILHLAAFSSAALAVAKDGPDASPARKAVEFLAREVPKWQAEHKCFSCHNNGDGARALFLARQLKLPVDASALETTLEFLRRPGAWKDNGPDGEFSDQRLAAIQFAFALTTASEANLVDDPAALKRAAELVAAEQDEDGSWRVDADSLAGSPVTYGRTLATAVSRRVLHAVGGEEFREPLEKTDRWLLAQQPKGVLDAAAVLIGIESIDRPESSDLIAEIREHCVAVIRKGEAEGGGWGSFTSSPPEVFDTAIVLLALKSLSGEDTKKLILRGREFLVTRQLEDGSWPGTTRPPGGDSYAQSISTTAWAVMALLKTDEVNTTEPSRRIETPARLPGR